MPATANLIAVTDDTFAEVVLASERPVVVDFWAPWCPGCAPMTAVLARLADELGDTVTFATVNYDENPASGRAYRVMALPTTLFFRAGEVIGSIVGARPASHVRQALAARLDPQYP